jgi:hypothetical protein
MRNCILQPVVVLLAGAMLFVSAAAKSQPGSIGGMIGKTDKSASGGGDQTPNRQGLPRRRVGGERHDTSLCSKMVGEWKGQRGELLLFRSNRTMADGSTSGTWSCDENRVSTAWDNGFRDQCTLSSDVKLLSCVNQFGFATSAKR